MAGYAIHVCAPDDVGELSDDRWSFPGFALSPRRLWLTAADRRWDTWWAVARRGAQVVGVLPLYRLRGASAAAGQFDPRALAPHISDHAPADQRRLLYVGGFNDLISGFTVSLSLSAGERDAVRSGLAEAAFAHARGEGLFPVVIYLRDDDAAVYRTTFGDSVDLAQIRACGTIEDLGADLDGYVAALTSRNRRRVRKDLADLAEQGLIAETVRPEEVMVAASELIAARKIRYGGMDHPRLAGLRLREWASSGADHSQAFVLRDAAGTVSGVSFAAVFGDMTELYEVGLAEDVPSRHLRFVELLVYAPLRYAIAHGARRLVLGLDSTEPKSGRGARITPVWAVIPRR